MTKTIFKTLLSLLILFSISCGDRPTGSDGGGIIGDNKETPQTETQTSKNFINNTFNKVVSYKGEIVEIRENSDAKSYSFDANADIKSVNGNGGGGMQNLTYKFWGMAPDNPELAYYYSENNGGGQNYYNLYSYALAFKNGTIAEESAHYGSELNKKMQAAMLEVDNVNTHYDHSKINPPQTTSPEANNWKSQVAGKTMTAYYNGDNSASFVFDNNGNLKITYQANEYDNNTGQPTGNKVTETENLTFWGARNNGTLYGLYYIDNGAYMTPRYNNKSFSINGSSIQQDYNTTENDKLMHPIDTSTHYDNTKLKTPQTTSPEANNWKSQVANKTFNSKSMTTYNYTFESGGNIKETTGSGQYAHTETYYFWGALGNNRVVYYKIDSINGKDYWKYCGFSFDIAKQEISKYDEYSAAYWNSYNNWSQSQNQNNINWSSYPLPTTKDIDWNQPTTGTLTTK